MKKINHTHFKLHLDTKTIFYTQENSENIMKKYGDLIIGLTTDKQIKKVQKDFSTQDVVVKAQIHAGGRGKGVVSNM